MIVCKSVVNAHVLKIPADVFLKKSLNFAEVEFRVDKNCAKVGFKNVWETLCSIGQQGEELIPPERHALGGVLVAIQ